MEARWKEIDKPGDAEEGTRNRQRLWCIEIVADGSPLCPGARSHERDVRL